VLYLNTCSAALVICSLAPESAGRELTTQARRGKIARTGFFQRCTGTRCNLEREKPCPAFLLVLVGSTCAEDKIIKEGPEAFGYATFKDDKVRVRFSQLQYVEEERKVKQGDKEVLVKVVRQRWAVVTSDFDPKKVKLYDDKGKEVAVKDIAKTLEKEQRVVLAYSGKLDPFFADFIKPGTYVLVLPDE
jgi:hypothetical protein